MHLTMTIRNNEQLLESVNSGIAVKYLFFWGHQKKGSNVNKSCFSQWYESSFEVEGVRYQTAEHYMMAEKARLFGDLENAQKAIQASNPGAAKAVGRLVKGFDNDIWIENRFNIVVKANENKFRQNPDLESFLVNTGSRVLVEASPVDKIWGIGLAADNIDCQNPNRWKGLNLLGYALMEVRKLLR